MTGSTEHAADAERLAEIDGKIAARRANLGGWMLSHSDGVFLREQLDTALRERDLAVAHDRQPYPTAEAYERACQLRDAALRDAEALREEVGRLRARIGAPHPVAGLECPGDGCHGCQYCWSGTPVVAETETDTKSLRHPLTGDTVVVSTETGRILETRPAASGEDVELARRLEAHTLVRLIEQHLSECNDEGYEKSDVLALAALTAARLSGRAEMAKLDEPVIEVGRHAECLSDVVSHHCDFVKACTVLRDQAEDDADSTYWQHQIDVLVRMKEQADAALKALPA